MSVLSSIPNGASNKDIRDTMNALLRRVAALEAAGTPDPVGAPAYTTQPSISPSTGIAGQTIYTATPGVVAGGTVVSRAWLLNGTAISTDLTARPAAGTSGTLTYQELASGPGGTTPSTILAAAVTAPASVTLLLSSAVANQEGNSGTTAFTWVLTLNRDSSTASYPFTWSVAGSGANPASAADFGGTFPSGSGTFAAGETIKTITVLVAGDADVEPDETFSLSVTASGLPTVTSMGTIINDDGSGAQSQFTMTQLAESKRIYQRTTTSGGGQSKGTGTIAVAINVATPGAIYARCRASDGTILQAGRSVATTTATGAQTVNITGVDARRGWFYLDLSADGSTWQSGTTLVGMFDNTAIGGSQSQGVRMIGKMPSYTGTNASLGVTIDPNSAVYARYTDSSRTVSTPGWAVPADASNYDSTFVSEYTRLMVAASGGNQGFIGHAVGSTGVADWQQGSQNYNDLMAVLDAAGGFARFIIYIGGNDAGSNTPPATIKSWLTMMKAGLAAHNAARGSNFDLYVCAMATRLVGGAGTVASVTSVRTAMAEWCAGNGATYLEPHDATLEDDVHQGQQGNVTLARHFYRAATAATDNGPTIASGTRSGATIVLTASAALALVGSPANRFSVYPAGTLANPVTVSSVAVDKTTITLTLSADPGTGALDVYWLRHPDPSGTTAASNMIYDTYTADGLPNGRQLQPTLAAPVAIAATASSGGGTKLPTAKINFADPTYTADPAGWNRWNAPQGGAGGPPTPSTLTILDPSGAATPWTATVTAFGDYGYGQPGTTTGNNTGIYPDDILLKYWFNSTGTTTFRINGLIVGKSYTLTLVGSRGATNRPVIYTVGGVSQNFDASSNTTRSAVFTFTATDTFVDVTFGKGSGGTYGYLNGATLVQNT